jgi:CO/xanthine dehydrogenase FAD-binding subunit
MIAGVEYRRPESREELVGALAELGAEAMVLGGGTIMNPALGRREISAAAILDPGALGLDGVEPGPDGGLVLGARVTYTSLLRSDLVADRAPLLRAVAGGITGGAQIRNQGTVGGSACYANPASEVPACLVALGARLTLLGPEGERALAAAEFFTGAFATARRPDEILTAIELPATGSSARWGYYKLKLSESSWPIATAVAGRGEGLDRIVLGGVAAVPLALEDGAWLARGSAPEQVDATVAGLVAEPWADVLADAEYRRRVAGPVLRRAWERVRKENGESA